MTSDSESTLAITTFRALKVSRWHVSSFPDEIERHIFYLASTDSRSTYRYLFVARRVYHWLEPILYGNVDVHCQRVAESFIRSLRRRPVFARTAVKVLHIRPSVTPEQGAEILRLCHGVKELTLQVINNLPDDRNPLRLPLSTLQLTTLSLDLASAFYGPMISLPDLPILRHVKRLHLSNSWIARRGLYVGLHKLDQLTHISFHVQPPGQWSIYSGILVHILGSFHALQAVVLWRRPYQAAQVIYDTLRKRGIADPRIVVFNSARFAECGDNGFWTHAMLIVQQRQNKANLNTGVYLDVFSDLHDLSSSPMAAILLL